MRGPAHLHGRRGQTEPQRKGPGYSALVVSQFTLYGDTKKGYRPSFIKAANRPLCGGRLRAVLGRDEQAGPQGRAARRVRRGHAGVAGERGPCTMSSTRRWTPTSGNEQKEMDPCKHFTSGAAPYYTNTFLLISDAGHAVVIDPARTCRTTIKFCKSTTRRSPLCCAPTATMTMWAAPRRCAGSDTPDLLRADDWPGKASSFPEARPRLCRKGRP